MRARSTSSPAVTRTTANGDTLVLSLTRVPYDIEAFEAAGPDMTVRWPVAHKDVRALNSALQRGLIGTVRPIKEEAVREVLVIAANGLLISLLTRCAGLLTAARARERGLEFVFSRESQVQDLLAGRGDTGVDLVFERLAARFQAAAQARPRNRPWRIAHRLITNRGPGWPWQAPVTVLNHNHLLQDTAREDRDHRFSYATADQLFGAAENVTAEPALRRRLEEIAGALAAEATSYLEDLGCQANDGFRNGMRQSISDWLATVAGHRERLSRAWRHPPKELWTGTGGNYVSRLARAAVRRGAGTVAAFEHGGGAHIHKDQTALHLQEFVLADRFVVDTAAKVAIYRQRLDPAKSVDGAPPEIVARSDGGSSFRWLDGTEPTRIRRVMYVTTAFVRDLQYPLLPLLPDVVYADWQKRLLDGLAALDFEVLCKQHPEGARAGRPLESSSRAEYLRGYFPDCMDRADAFVFDYPATTSLWEAMCTSKPIVFIDLGLTEWLPEAWEAFTRRCAVVPAAFDEWNRPQVDFARLRDALRSAPLDDGFAEQYLTGHAR